MILVNSVLLALLALSIVACTLLGPVRLDLSRFWSLKIEGHFMDGVGAPGQAHGFYPQDNPQGLELTTHMVALRTSWNF